MPLKCIDLVIFGINNLLSVYMGINPDFIN